MVPAVRVATAFFIVFGVAGIAYHLLGFGLGGTLFYLTVGALVILAIVLTTPYSISRHYEARTVKDGDLPRVERVVEDLSPKFSLSRPRLLLIESVEPNAFAFGFGKRTYIGVTRGLMSILGDDELKAVVAHEYAHIWSRDSMTQVLGIAVKKTLFAFAVLLAIFIVIAGAIVAALLLSAAGSKSKGATKRLMIMPRATALAIYSLSPILLGACSCFFSRKAELRADAYSARVNGRPEDLALALIKINEYKEPDLAARKHGVYSSLWIASKGDEGFLGRLLSTHPPVKERVWRLIEMVPLKTSVSALRGKPNGGTEPASSQGNL